MKKIMLVFKNGTTVTTNYSYAVYGEISENLGKDHKVEAKNFTVNTKALEGVFFFVEDEAAE